MLDHEGGAKSLNNYFIVLIRGTQENRLVGDERRVPTIEVLEYELNAYRAGFVL